MSLGSTLSLEGTERARPVAPRAPRKYTNVTARHIQTARFVEQGLRNKEIAELMGLAPSTVKVYVGQLYERLGVSSRVGLANWLRRHDDFPQAPGFDAHLDSDFVRMGAFE